MIPSFRTPATHATQGTTFSIPARRRSPAHLLLFAFESQRGEGRFLHGGRAFYELSILPALNRSELP